LRLTGYSGRHRKEFSATDWVKGGDYKASAVRKWRENTPLVVKIVLQRNLPLNLGVFT
jgi:hypothetical protein